MTDGPRIPVDLEGVPETLLWTLYYRAHEAARPDAVITDPVAIELVGRIDYPFEERLGRGSRRGQWQALRARTFDDQVRRHLAAHPGATVVALGEGLETQFWRVDDGRVHWIGVDLPETADLRRAVLPGHDRRRHVDASVLDDGWLREVVASDARDVLVTAQGLLMYLPRERVHDLLTRCARALPGSRMLFDGVPRWTSAATKRTAAVAAAAPPGALVPPPMPWAMDAREARALRALPGVLAVARLHPPRGRGPLFGVVLPALERAPVLRGALLSVWGVRLSAEAGDRT